MISAALKNDRGSIAPLVLMGFTMMEGGDVEPGHAGPVDVAGAPAAAFGEQHHRHAPLFGQLQHAVGLLVVVRALSAGQHRVVVAQHEAACALGVAVAGVDGAQACDDAVGR